MVYHVDSCKTDLSYHRVRIQVDKTFSILVDPLWNCHIHLVGLVFNTPVLNDPSVLFSLLSCFLLKHILELPFGKMLYK